MRYVLRREGGGAGAFPADLPGVTVVERTGDSVILVEADPVALERHRDVLRGWSVSSEVTHPLPGLRRPTPRPR